MRSPIYFFSTAALASALLAQGSPVFAGEDPGLTQEIATTAAIFARRQRDHRLALHDEKFAGCQAVQVYLTLSDYAIPVSFTLGWLRYGDVAGQKTYLNESGEKIPLPGEKPGKSTSGQADLSLTRGFDLVSEGNLKAAFKEFQAGVRLSPQSAKAHNNLGACLIALGDEIRATAELDQAIKLKNDYAIALTNRALANLMVNKPDLAAADAKAALTHHKMLRPALVALGKSYLDVNLTDEALSLADRLTRQFPEDAPASMLAGDARMARGDLKGARQHFMKAVIAMPGNAEALLRLAHACQQLGDLDQALKRARDATQVAPGDAKAHFVLGRYLEMNRQSRPAQVQYERALELNPPEKLKVSIYGALLRLLVNTNKLAQADKLSRGWLADNPECAECHYNYAWVASNLPSKPKSDSVLGYRQALALNPELAGAHYNLAIMLAKEGQLAQAVKELKLFIKKAPLDPDCAKARQLLAQLENSRL